MRKLNLLLSAATVAMATPAFAQEAPQDAAAADDKPIIVTATRRAEVLTDVPLAISAVGQEKLQNSGATDLRALNQLAPSLLISGATTETAYSARMRGIGTVGENPGLESSVAVFVDGVYRTRTGVGLTELGEIERIEVLRGPQGTLFGRNASAGLIHVITAGPKFEFGGHAEASYGNFDALRLSAGVTGPITETVAARLEGVYYKRDGFVKDLVSGRDLHNRDRYLVRGQLLVEPTDKLSIKLIGDYGSRDEECCGATYLPARNLARNATTGDLIITPNSTAAYERSLGGIINESTYSRRVSISPGRGYGLEIKDWGMSGEINAEFGAANLTSISAYRVWDAKSDQDGDFNNLDIFQREGRQQRFKNFTQEVRLQGTAMGDRLDWLVGGFFAKESLLLSDTLKFGGDYGTFASCLVMSGVNAVIPGSASPTSPGCINAAFRPTISTVFGTGVVSALDNIYGMRNVGANPNVFRQNSRNYALFTHNKFEIVEDKLTLTLGARYTNERKRLNAVINNSNTTCAANIAALSAGVTATGATLAPTLRALACASNLNTLVNGTYNDSKKEDEWTGTAVLSFKPTDKLMTYVSFSKGYKSGGFNLDQAAFVLAAPSTSQLKFAPETVKAMEAGIKWDGPGIDLGATIFRQSFSNFQLNTFNGVSFIVETVQSCGTDLAGRDKNLIENDSACPASDVRSGVISQGVELEASLRPARNFNIGLGATYTDTHYRNNLTGLGGRSFPGALFQLPGRKLSNAPAYIMTGSLGWTPDLGSNGLTGLAYLDFRYQSEVNTGSDLDAEKVTQGFPLFNARLGVYGPDKKWGVEFWGQNILNHKYLQIVADAPLQGSGTVRAVQGGLSASASQQFIGFPGEPRTYGITVKTKF